MTILYLICSVRRNGTNFFQDHLRASGAGDPREYLNGRGKRHWTRPQLIDLVKGQGGSVHGCKVFWNHLEIHDTQKPGIWLDDFVREYGADRVVYIHLERLDLVRAAVSWARVEAGGNWCDRQGVTQVNLAFDAQDIRRRVHWFAREHARWRAYFQTRGITPLHMTYEALKAEPQAEVQRALNHIGDGLLYTAPESVPMVQSIDTQAIIAQYHAHILGEC